MIWSLVRAPMQDAMVGLVRQVRGVLGVLAPLTLLGLWGLVGASCLLACAAEQLLGVKLAFFRLGLLVSGASLTCLLAPLSAAAYLGLGGLLQRLMLHPVSRALRRARHLGAGGAT